MADIRLIFATPFSCALCIDIAADRIVASNWAPRLVVPAAKAGTGQTELVREATRQLLAYMDARICVFDLPLVLRGTEFEVAVWRAVMTIPFGTCVSYAEVARAVDRPRAQRAVARAMSNAPFDLLVPAHRVLGADGKIKGVDVDSMRARLLTFERSQGRRA